MTLLDGPRVAPASGRPPRSLVVLLHGYGADGLDLIDLARAWAPRLPDTAFVAPNAPERCDASAFGYQWFPLSFRDPHEYRRGAEAATPLLDAFLDGEQMRLGLDDRATALVGFSQGAMMALHVGLRRIGGVAGIVGYSGLLPGPETIEAEALASPPVLLVHGSADDVVDPAHLPAAVAALTRIGIAAEWHTRDRLGHGIDDVGLAIAGRFLERVLA
ncbi:alpha/beta hydrolase [Methyloraptor flagellatus]|jgi:phospholipase/carboxylesterase|uniref:Prolyl oligopeptidase family serine peptidase n=1 Tax=Methyloraptor flagellatus TaxID=3162530 RepID=A0AAU7XCI7_9HYPH